MAPHRRLSRFLRCHRRAATLLLTTCCLLATATTGPTTNAARASFLSVVLSTDAQGVGWTRLWNTPVYAAPSFTATLLDRLDRNQQVNVLGQHYDAKGQFWTHILLWNTFDGWIPGSFVAPRPASASTGGGSGSFPTSRGPHPSLPVAATGTLDIPAYLRIDPRFSAHRLSRLPAHTSIQIDHWAVDAAGGVWYHGTVATSSASMPHIGWVWGDAVTTERGGVSHGAPIQNAALANPVAVFSGTSMWITYPLMRVTPPAYIVEAAVRQGITHIYVEVATSYSGFYGAPGLAALLPLAHKAGVRVIAWVYPYLYNIPADVMLTVRAARYRAPSGDVPDGVVADVEENMNEAAVRAYGQVTRALLGGQEAMGIATYPPQQALGKTYPFRTIAHSWDVILPMDYWHARQRPYTADETAAFVAQSISLIRKATGNPAQAVEPVGQSFDLWPYGLDAPSATEIRGAVQGALTGGAVGIGFFEWNHATPDEWAAIGAGAEAWRRNQPLRTAVEPHTAGNWQQVAEANVTARRLQAWLLRKQGSGATSTAPSAPQKSGTIGGIHKPI